MGDGSWAAAACTVGPVRKRRKPGTHTTVAPKEGEERRAWLEESKMPREVVVLFPFSGESLEDVHILNGRSQ